MTVGMGMNVVAPQKDMPKRPWVLDETLPKYKDPLEEMAKRQKEKMLEEAKNKPESERTLYEKMLVAEDFLNGMKPTVIYMA